MSKTHDANHINSETVTVFEYRAVQGGRIRIGLLNEWAKDALGQLLMPPTNGYAYEMLLDDWTTLEHFGWFRTGTMRCPGCNGLIIEIYGWEPNRNRQIAESDLRTLPLWSEDEVQYD